MELNDGAFPLLGRHDITDDLKPPSTALPSPLAALGRVPCN